MAKQTVPIPGEILKTTVVFGLTFDELLVLAAIPLVLVLPSAMISAIPIWISLVSVGFGFIGVLVVVFKTPDGQSPVGWFPAYLERKLKPNEYQLKPRDQTKHGKLEARYLNVVHTAPLIQEESTRGFSAEDVREMVDEIDNAEKLDIPEWVLEEERDDSGRTGVVNRVIGMVKP